MRRISEAEQSRKRAAETAADRLAALEGERRRTADLSRAVEAATTRLTDSERERQELADTVGELEASVQRVCLSISTPNMPPSAKDSPLSNLACV